MQILFENIVQKYEAEKITHHTGHVASDNADS